MSQREVLFEGLSEEEILDLPCEHVEKLILLGEPLVFRAGSAEILGSFKIVSHRLVVELAQIEGGGEGVLISLSSLAKRYVTLRKLSGVEWVIHAVTCAKPNLKLRRVLERRGFVVENVEGVKPITFLKPSPTTTRSRRVMPMESRDKLKFDPNTLAVQYYFGDLQYWKLPGICIDALEHGFDGRALRRLSGLVNPVQSDIRQEEIDSAFREMGVNAPISKDEARLVLARDAAKRALAGETNVFNEATHIRIHICELHDPPPELESIVALSKKSEHAPRLQWGQLEKQLHDAMSAFLSARK